LTDTDKIKHNYTVCGRKLYPSQGAGTQGQGPDFQG